MNRDDLRKVEIQWSCECKEQTAYFHKFYSDGDIVYALLEVEDGTIVSCKASSCYKFKFIS